MNKSKKSLAMLSTAAIAGLLVAAVSTPVSAKTTALAVTGTDTKTYEYNYASLRTSATAYILNGASDANAKLYSDFITRKSTIKAYYDDVKAGYVDATLVNAAAVKAATSVPKTTFVLDTFTSATTTATTPLTTAKVTADAGIISIDGNKVITVSSVSAITASTTVGTVATLPTTATVTLNDGTTKTTAITWNAAATAAATYATAGTVTVSGTLADYSNYAVSGTVSVTAPTNLAVSSVTAVNAKQIQITFNKPVDKDTVIADQGTKDTSDDLLKATAVNIAGLDTQAPVNTITVATAKASLSADGKVLTISAAGSEYFKGNYSVAVLTAVKDANEVALVSKYTSNINVNDTTRPTLVGTTYDDFNTAQVAFSESISTPGAISFTLADGTSLVTNPIASAVNGKIKIDLSSLNVADFNKNITVTIVGATDYNNNVISPNPVTVTVKKDMTDTTKPTVSSVTVTGNKTFDIKFSEKLIGAPVLASVGGTTATPVQDTTDPTLYHVTLSAAVAGLQTVSVTTFADLTNNSGLTYSKAVNFDADTTAPTLASSKVEQIDGVEYLVLTYNENVAPVNGIVVSPTYLDNYVTTAGTAITTSGANFTLYKPVDGKSTSVKLDLTTITKAATYTADLPKGLVTDLYSNVAEKVTGVTFARTSNSTTNAPKVTSVTASATDNNIVTVVFDKAVDGASAVNVSNYTVEGATVSSAKLTNNSTTATVELTLAKDSNTLTGSRAVKITGVKSQSGTTMDDATTTSALVENVRPTITKAELTATGIITLTASEAVFNNSATDDFDVYVGGVKITTGVSTALVTGTASKTLTITLTNALTATQVASGVVVKPTSTININDASLAGAGETTGNVLNFTSITAQ